MSPHQIKNGKDILTCMIVIIVFNGILNSFETLALDKSAKEIGADILQEFGISGKDNTICVLDDGVDYTHENLGQCSQAQFLAANCSTI